jgi:putative peptidoglycan lipid II flippase
VSAGFLRSTAVITAGNAVSRVSGFVRVIAIAAALGTTFLGNTYQTANLVSNILFELLAAGLLSSVLVPTFVRLFDAGRDEDAQYVAGALLGLALVFLGVLTLLGLAARPWLMRVLTLAVRDPAVREDELRLGSFFLIFFLPQVLLYAVGAVATAMLHGRRRFAAPAFAPVANNVIVTATMVVFVVQRHVSGTEGRPGLDISGAQQAILAVGTTLGVLGMTIVPVLAVRRAGLRLRPRWDVVHPEVRRLGRQGVWAVAFLGLNQVLIAVTLVLANRIEGGVVAFQTAFTFFLLPFAIFANPIFTALYPRLSADAARARWREFMDTASGGVRLIAFFVLPAAALLIALGRPTLQLLRFGSLDAAGASLVARVLSAYALGLVGYALFQHLTRASYATADARTPALVHLGATAAGVTLMIVLFLSASGSDKVVVLGVAHSIAMVGAAVVLFGLLRRRVRVPAVCIASLARSLTGAAAGGLVARVLADALALDGRRGAALTIVVAGAAGIAVYACTAWLTRAPELRGLHLPPASVPEGVP